VLPVAAAAWQVGAVHDLTRRGILLMLTVGLAAGCDEKPPSWATGGGARTSTPAAAAAPATVNGVAIGAAELALAMATAARAESPHGGGSGVTPDRGRVLAGLIDQELAAQRAVALGLDADPAFKDELAKLDAQLASVRRQRLAALFDKDQAARWWWRRRRCGRSTTSVDEIRTRVRLADLVPRSRQGHRRAAETRGGATFEAVAQPCSTRPGHDAVGRRLPGVEPATAGVVDDPAGHGGRRHQRRDRRAGRPLLDRPRDRSPARRRADARAGPAGDRAAARRRGRAGRARAGVDRAARPRASTSRPRDERVHARDRVATRRGSPVDRTPA
jgi:hypothetical protein